MKARRQIIDPLTGAKVPASSPVAVDTGNVIVGTDTVVPEDARDPSRDRFGIDPAAVPELQAQVENARSRRRAPKGRGPAFKATMGSTAEGVKEFEGLNPAIFDAPGFDDVDVHDRAKAFLHDTELQRGKRFTRADKTAAGKKVLGARSGSAIARGVLSLLFAQAKGGRWRAVPWQQVMRFTGELADAVGAPSTVHVPIAAGLEPPDVLVQRARDELGETAARKLARELNRDELRALADRYENAIRRNGEDCLSGEALRVAKDRLATLRKWARNPDAVPPWACVGTEGSEGLDCSYPGLLDDIAKLERSCEVDYDVRWPVEAAQAACESGREEGRTGLAGKPCDMRRPREARWAIVKGRRVRV